MELIEDIGSIFFGALILPHAGGGNPGVEVTCMGNGITDECTFAEGAAEFKLEGSTLLEIFTEAFDELVGLKLASCSLGGAETGILEEPSGNAVSVIEGGETSISSETSEA